MPILFHLNKSRIRYFGDQRKGNCHCRDFLYIKFFMRTSSLMFQQLCLFKNVCECFKYIMSFEMTTQIENYLVTLANFYHLECLQMQDCFLVYLHT